MLIAPSKGDDTVPRGRVAARLFTLRGLNHRGVHDLALFRLLVLSKLRVKPQGCRELNVRGAKPCVSVSWNDREGPGDRLSRPQIAASLEAVARGYEGLSRVGILSCNREMKSSLRAAIES